MSKEQEEMKILLKNIIGTVIGLVVLFIFGAIIINLSAMEKEVISRYGITIADILSLIVLSLTIVVIFNFSKKITIMIERLSVRFKGAAKLFENFMYILMIILGFYAFRGILYPIFVDINLGWLYQIIFVLMSVYPVYVIASIAINSSEIIVDMIMGNDGQKAREAKPEQEVVATKAAEEEEEVEEESK